MIKILLILMLQFLFFFFSEYRKTYSGPKKEKIDNKETANEKAAKKMKNVEL